MPTICFPKMRSQTFLTNGSWTCPQGVTQIVLFGVGGGGGGGRPYISGGGGGGWGAAITSGTYSVTAGTTYTVTIGAGGAGRTGSGGDGSDGGAASFGALQSFPGGKGGTALANQLVINQSIIGTPPGNGMGIGGASTNYAAGGTASGTLFDGGSGGGACISVGGDAGNGAGTSAAANSGAGGGGGGSVAGPADGGDGGSGKIIVYWMSIR